MNTPVTAQQPDRLAKAGIWYTRVILILASLLFGMIGLRGIIHPVVTANQADITLGSARAMSVARVSLGALPFGIAVFSFISLFWNNTLYRGILGVFTIIAAVTVVRIIGYSIDGAAPFLANEVVLVVLAGVALYLEARRRSYL